MQYPADGAALLAPRCCRVQGPPVMWPCCGRLSAVHTFPFITCAETGATIRTNIAISKWKDMILLFTNTSMPAAHTAPRAFYDLPEDGTGTIAVACHALGEVRLHFST